MSNREKKYTPPKRAPRSGSPGADALTRANAVKAAETEQLRGDVIPSPVPYDQDELGSGRGVTYEWEYWISRVQEQIDDINAGGGGGGGGGGTGSVTYVHTQSSAASVWSISHSMATKPNVLVIDSSGQELMAEIHFPNNSLVTITHAVPYAGVAYLRA